MREFVNDFGQIRWQPEMPDGRALHRRRIGPQIWVDEWRTPGAAVGIEKLYRFRWRARLRAWRKLRSEAKWNWKPVDV